MSRALQESTSICAKSAGRPKAADVEARTHVLIETAGELFLKHGYTKTSLEAIAREAHVAVRTIYVKFGGKAGLLSAVIQSRRERFLVRDMETDARPFKEIVDEFARHFLDLLWSPDALCMQRVVIAEASSNPELARIFYEAGPKITRDMLERLFARADIRAQLRDDLPFDTLPLFLINCIVGDPLARFLFPLQMPSREEVLGKLDERLSLFYRAVLRRP
jgi:TetR/AcrR family transcriptional repressor of mexJK operon